MICYLSFERGGTHCSKCSAQADQINPAPGSSAFLRIRLKMAWGRRDSLRWQRGSCDAGDHGGGSSLRCLPADFICVLGAVGMKQRCVWKAVSCLAVFRRDSQLGGL